MPFGGVFDSCIDSCSGDGGACRLCCCCRLSRDGLGDDRGLCVADGSCDGLLSSDAQAAEALEAPPWWTCPFAAGITAIAAPRGRTMTWVWFFVGTRRLRPDRCQKGVTDNIRRSPNRALISTQYVYTATSITLTMFGER